MTPALLSCLSLVNPAVVLDHFFMRNPWSILLASDSALDAAKEILERCLAEGAQVLHPGHADYPDEFFDLIDPPLFLAYRGKPVWKERPCLSVVGSREPGPVALEWMELHLDEVIRRRGMVTVSGGARGIDQKAHAISIRAGRPTVAFLPSGLFRLYPADFAAWIPEILACGGAVLSEFHPLKEMRRHHFEKRNRMIAALGRLLFVVEARRRSGSTMTARLARELSRTVCVLPSSPGNPRAAGTLDLLFDHAFPLRDAADLITLFDLCAHDVPRGGGGRLGPG